MGYTRQSGSSCILQLMAVNANHASSFIMAVTVSCRFAYFQRWTVLGAMDSSTCAGDNTLAFLREVMRELIWSTARNLAHTEIVSCAFSDPGEGFDS